MVESPASFDRVTCLPPKNASAPWGGPGSRWLTIVIWQVSYVQYLLACQKSQRSTPYNIVKSGLPWKRVFRRRHLGRRVTAVTCLRWPTVVRAILNGTLFCSGSCHVIEVTIRQSYWGTTSSDCLVAEQITVRIVQIMIQATDLAQILYGGHYSRK